MMGSSGTARSCSRRLALFLVSLLGHCSYFFLSFSHALPYTYTPGHLMGISGATGAEHNPLSLFLPTSFFTNFPPLGKCWFLSSPLTQLSMQKQILQLYLEDEACVVCFAKQASVVSDSAALWTARLLCLWGFSRQEYWNGLPAVPSSRGSFRRRDLLALAVGPPGEPG